MGDESDPRRRYRFGVFHFDPDTLELHKSGRVVSIRPQSLKLLRLLLSRPGDLVSREAIQQALWSQDTFVDFEQGVNHCVKQLRSALGDDAEAPRYIQTLPRRGYRFVAPVESIAEPETTVGLTGEGGGNPFRRMGTVGLVSMGVAAAVVAGLVVLITTRDRASSAAAQPSSPTLAVLPFELVNTPPAMAYLGISLADAVITRLAAGGQFRVRPTAAIVRYEKHPIDLRQVGQALRADYVVSGTLEPAGDMYRVRLQLMPSAPGLLAWSDSIDVPGDDMLGLEHTIADHVIGAIRGKAATRAAREAGWTHDPAAHDLYLQGRFYLTRYTSHDTHAAVAAFERALAADDTYALAHAGLAKAAAQMYIRFAAEPDVGTWKTRAEHHAARALQLDGTLAEAHEALAAVARYTEFDWDYTIEQSLEALRLNPSLDLPHYYIASALEHIGRLNLVESEVVAGLDVNPMNLAEAFRLRGVAAVWSGRFGDARTYLERVRELADRPVSDPHLAQALYSGGEPELAQAMLAGLGGSAQAEQRAAALLASFLAARGEKRQALALVQRVQNRSYVDHHVAYSLGAAYAGLGQPVEALHWLREATRTGFLCRTWYEHDRLLDPLRAHPEFAALLADISRTADRIASRYPHGL